MYDNHFICLTHDSFVRLFSRAWCFICRAQHNLCWFSGVPSPLTTPFSFKLVGGFKPVPNMRKSLGNCHLASMEKHQWKHRTVTMPLSIPWTIPIYILEKHDKTYPTYIWYLVFWTSIPWQCIYPMKKTSGLNVSLDGISPLFFFPLFLIWLYTLMYEHGWFYPQYFPSWRVLQLQLQPVKDRLYQLFINTIYIAVISRFIKPWTSSLLYISP